MASPEEAVTIVRSYAKRGCLACQANATLERHGMTPYDHTCGDNVAAAFLAMRAVLNGLRRDEVVVCLEHDRLMEELRCLESKEPVDSDAT